jgi:hypothetical protein
MVTLGYFLFRYFFHKGRLGKNQISPFVYYLVVKPCSLTLINQIETLSHFGIIGIVLILKDNVNKYF